MMFRRSELGARRRFRRSRGRWSRRFVALILVASIGFAVPKPANAFFDALNPAAWAVVVEMGIVISKMVSVKRQIENVRNLARSEAMGAFAPLVEGLAPVTEAISLGKQAIREASSLRRTALASLPVASVDLTPLPSTPFNGVMKRCAAPAPDGGGDPVPSSSLRTPAVPAAAQASGASSFSSFRAGSPGDYPGFGFRPILRQADPNSQQQTPPPNNNQNNQQSTDPPGESATVPEALEFHELCMPDPAVAYDTQAAADLEEVAEDAIDAYFGEDADYDATAPAAMGEALEASLEEFQMHAERSEDEIAQAQALIDGMMAVYEEFYGCLAVPDDGEMLDDPETPYCLSNLGKGMGDRKEGDGTASLLDDILAKLDTIGRQPDGNASQTQLSTLQTQLQVYIARATAMRTQARAWELEMQNEKKLMAEAQQRRIYEAFNRDLACKGVHGATSQFVPDPGSVTITEATRAGAVLGRCTEPNERSTAQAYPASFGSGFGVTGPLQLGGPGSGAPAQSSALRAAPVRVSESQQPRGRYAGAQIGARAEKSFAGGVQDALRKLWGRD